MTLSQGICHISSQFSQVQTKKVCWILLVGLFYLVVKWTEARIRQEPSLPQSDWPASKFVGYFLMNDECGRIQECSATARQVVLGCTRKPTKQALESKPGNRTPLRFLLPPELLRGFPQQWAVIVSQIKPFLPQVFDFGQGLSQPQGEKKTSIEV